MQQFRRSVFSLTLMSKGEKRTRVPLLPSMPKGEIVGRFTVGSKLVIDGKNGDGKDQRWKRKAMAKISNGKDNEIAKCRNRKVDKIAKRRNHEGGQNCETISAIRSRFILDR
jgi:hypothetical protein